MQPPTLTLSVVSGTEQFVALRAEWNALCARAGLPHVFASFDWWLVAWTHVAAPRGNELWILTGRIDGRLVLVWPMMLRDRVLRMLTSHTLEYRDVIAEPSEYLSNWLDQAWSYAVSASGADVFLLQNLPSSGYLGRRLSSTPGASIVQTGWRQVIRFDRFGGVDAYWSALPRALAADQRRQWKRLRQALPGVSFRLVTRSDAAADVMEWIATHKITWAEARGQQAVWFTNADVRAALQAAAEAAAASGTLVMASLSDGATTVSAGWGYVCGDEFMLHAFAYDAAYSKYSPSRLLLECMMRHCHERGLRTFDLMSGDEGYKRIWATDVVRLDSYAGHFNWRGAWLLRLGRIRHAGQMAPAVIKRMYRWLPKRARNLVEGRLRAYDTINFVMHVAPAVEPGARVEDDPAREPEASAPARP